jgi:biotin synthase-related radical SAM superfamily protein
LLVYLLGCLEEARVVALGLAVVDEGLEVFVEAASPVSGSCLEE